jgi:hypothetical protein
VSFEEIGGRLSEVKFEVIESVNPLKLSDLLKRIEQIKARDADEQKSKIEKAQDGDAQSISHQFAFVFD